MLVGAALTPRRGALAEYITLTRDNRNFRYLWFGQIVSLLGDWFNLIASAALISSLTGSGLAVGGLFVVRMLAPFLISPVAGVVADRYNRKRLLIMTDILRAAVVACFLLVRDAEHVWLLYALTAVQLALSGFFFPARTAMLPDLVGEEDLGTANALTSVTWSVMLAFGAALGGLVAGQWGAYPSFTIDALTFLLSAVLLAQINYRPTEKAPDADTSVRAAFVEYFDGLRYLRLNVDILVTASLKAMLAFTMAAAFDVIQVAITEDVFVYGKEGGTGLGIMYAMIGIGTGIGPIAARHFTGDRDRALRNGIVISYLLVALGLAIVAPLSSFPVVLFGVVVRGLGGGTVWVFSTQLLLQQVTGDIRGRIFATEFMLFTLFYSISASLTGVMLESSALSISGTIWIFAGLNLVPAAVWAWWNWRGRARFAG